MLWFVSGDIWSCISLEQCIIPSFVGQSASWTFKSHIFKQHFRQHEILKIIIVCLRLMWLNSIVFWGVWQAETVKKWSNRILAMKPLWVEQIVIIVSNFSAFLVFYFPCWLAFNTYSEIYTLSSFSKLFWFIFFFNLWIT